MNPQPVLRPNVVQSSPSPTSIIASINQSNYLCSQTPDTQSTSTPQIIPNKDDVFQHPGKTNIGLEKQSQFKQVYIIQKPKNSKTDTENIITQNQSLQSYTIVNGMVDVSYKTRQSIETQPPEKQEKYDLKNLAINGNVSKFSNIQMYQQQLNRTEIYSNQHLKVDNFQDSKVKLFMPCITENVMRISNLSQVFVNDARPECPEEADTKPLHTMTLPDRPFTHNTDNKEPSNECRFESTDANKD